MVLGAHVGATSAIVPIAPSCRARETKPITLRDARAFSTIRMERAAIPGRGDKMSWHAALHDSLALAVDTSLRFLL